MAKESKIIEMYEEIYPSLLSLRSSMFIRLQKMIGGYWDK
jgi:hypothetical protein